MSHDWHVNVSEEIGGVVRIGVLAVDGVTIREADPALDGPLATAAAAAVSSASEAGHVLPAVRRMYYALGLDPTKTRPSSEALLRRVRRDQPLPRINTAVDVGNWCSLETQLPYGLYDRGRVRAPIEARLGREGEEYAGIRKEVVHVAGRLTLADAEGPFGNPTSDSARTSVSEATTHLLVVVFCPRVLLEAVIVDAIALTAARLRQFTGGVAAGTEVV